MALPCLLDTFAAAFPKTQQNEQGVLPLLGELLPVNRLLPRSAVGLWSGRALACGKEREWSRCGNCLPLPSMDALDLLVQHATSTEGVVAIACLAVGLIAIFALVRPAAAKSGESPTGGPLQLTPFSPGKALDRLKWRHLRLVHAEKTSHNTRLLHFELEPDEDLSVLPVGRHVTVAAEIDGELVKRPYTPISMPSERGRVALLIKMYRVGAMSKHLFELPLGSYVGMRGPIGRHTYKPNQHSHLLMLAAGTGLTPMLQIIRCGLEDPSDTTCYTLFFQNREQRDILLLSDLRQLSQAHPDRLAIALYLSRVPDEGSWETEDGRQREGYITRRDLQEELSARAAGGLAWGGEGAATQQVLVCGPSGFCDCMVELADKCGVTKENIKVF